VSDRTIRACIRNGATTLDAVSAETRASLCCGGCRPTVSRLLDEELGITTVAPPPAAAANAALAETPPVAASAESAIHASPLRPLRVVRSTRAA